MLGVPGRMSLRNLPREHYATDFDGPALTGLPMAGRDFNYGRVRSKRQ